MEGERWVRGTLPRPGQIITHYGDEWSVIFVNRLEHGDCRCRVRDAEGNKSWITLERPLQA